MTSPSSSTCFCSGCSGLLPWSRGAASMEHRTPGRVQAQVWGVACVTDGGDPEQQLVGMQLPEPGRLGRSSSRRAPPQLPVLGLLRHHHIRLLAPWPCCWGCSWKKESIVTGLHEEGDAMLLFFYSMRPVNSTMDTHRVSQL